MPLVAARLDLFCGCPQFQLQCLTEINFNYWKDQPEGNEYFDNALKRVARSFPDSVGIYHILCFAKDFGLQAAAGSHATDCSERQTLASQDTWVSLSASNQGPRLRLTSFRSPAGYTERYEYDDPPANARPSPFWRLKRVFPAQSGTATPEFPSLTLVYNRLGQVREAHDAYSALVCTSCAPEAQRAPVTFYPGGRAFAASMQPNVMDVRLAFDYRDRLVQQQVRVDANTATPQWHISTMTYDGRDRLKSRTGPDGQRVEFEYNERNLPWQARRFPRPGSAEAAASQSFTVNADYHERWDVITSLTDARGNATLYNYAAPNQWRRLDSVELPSAYNADTAGNATSIWSFEYDGYRRLTKQTDPRGNDVTFAYDDDNNFPYEGDWRLMSVSAERGTAWGGGVVTTSFQRNSWGLVTHTDQPGPGFADATYDDDGRTLTTSGPLNTFARTTLDLFGRPHEAHARVTAGGVQKEQCTHQEFSRTGKTTLAGRARLVNQSAACESPQNYSLASFDHADRPVIVTDPEGRKIRFTYDLAGRVIREEREASAGVFETWKEITYEPGSNNIDTITDGEGRATKYVYNGWGRLASATYGFNSLTPSTETFAEYDANGNLTRHVTRAGQTLHLGYDSRNRPIWFSQGNGGPEEPMYARARISQNQYDGAGNLRFTISTDYQSFCHAAVQNEYDGLSRLRREWQYWGLQSAGRNCWADAKAVSYGYQDPQGNDRSRPTSITWPDGFAVYYDLDDLDRVTRIRLCSSGGPGCTGATLVTYAYDELGRRTQAHAGGGAGALSLYVWEEDNDLAAFAHDTADTGDVVFASAFNRAGEPVAENISNTDYVWKAATTATATVNALNQFPSWQIEGQGAETLQYDANGNLHVWRGRRYVHDPQNRLREVRDNVSGNLIADYEYDAGGRRVRKTTYSPTVTHTFFLYAGDAEIGEYSFNSQTQGNVLERRYVPGAAGETVAMIEGSAITYLHTDRTGSVVATSDSQGNVLARYQISEWGELQPSQLGGPPFRFIGARFDAETGLYYMRARYYSPELGRFVETDPAGYGQSTNLYGYGANSPLVFADPSGEWTVEAALIAAAVAAVVSTATQAEMNGGDYSQVNYKQVAFSAASAFALSAVLGELFGGASDAGCQVADATAGAAPGNGTQPIIVTAARKIGAALLTAEGLILGGAILVTGLAGAHNVNCPPMESGCPGSSPMSNGTGSSPPPPPASGAGNSASLPPDPNDPMSQFSATQQARIYRNQFLSNIRNNSSLSRQANPLSQTEVDVLVARARSHSLRIDANPAGMQGLEVTGRWAGVRHFKIGNVHIPIQSGVVIPP